MINFNGWKFHEFQITVQGRTLTVYIQDIDLESVNTWTSGEDTLEAFIPTGQKDKMLPITFGQDLGRSAVVLRFDSGEILHAIK